MCIAAAVRHKLTLSSVILGFIFFINAFVAIWVVFPLCAVMIVQLFRGEARPLRMLIQTAAGGGIAAFIALPVVLSVLQNHEYGATPDFDYNVYLQQYYPNHYLFSSIPLIQKFGLVGIAAISIISFVMLGGQARYFIATTIGVILTYIIGIFLPNLTHSPLFLNLHLLRSGVMLHIICALATSALAARWWFNIDKVTSLVKAPILIVILSFPIFTALYSPILYYLNLLVLFIFLVLATTVSRYGAGVGSHLRVSKSIVVIWLVLAVSAQVVATLRLQQGSREWISEWERVAEWAKANTPPDSLFLNPVEKGRENAVFDTVSHRAVWVDWKRGGVIVWYPSYYKVWRQRMMETENLKTLDAKLGGASFFPTRQASEFARISAFGCTEM